MLSPAQFYSTNELRYRSDLQSLTRKMVLVSILRLLSFVAFLTVMYFFISRRDAGSLIAATVLFLIFAGLLRTFWLLASRKRITEKLLFINRNELSVLQNLPNAFPDGSTIVPESIHCADLDVFGNKSLFHLLNRTTTTHGLVSLARMLDQPSTARENIIQHQEAVQQWASQAAERQLVTAHGLLQQQEAGSMTEISNWINLPTRMAGNTVLKFGRYLWPLASIASLLYYLDSDNPVPLGITVIVSWLITGSYFKYIAAQHTLIGRKHSILQQYAAILDQFRRSDPGASRVLRDLHETAGNAHNEVLRLSRLTSLFDQRLNLLVSVFLNIFFLYDIQCMMALEDWKERNSAHFQDWIQAVGEMEALNSLATFAYNNPQYHFPLVLEGKPFIETKNMGHPLIPAQLQVVNDFTAGMHEKLLLVTGSNMSGKSTFLRTVGINLLLAQCGAPACATQFSFTPMNILSSIRISDSLQENTSYFMAELKRLQHIISFLQTERPALVLIDEVLRGTNSEDKSHGSEQLIKKLLGFNCLTLFATHDLSLSSLEDEYPQGVRNYCFESVISNGELSFDYKLNKGVAKNKNASFLMQKMEII